MYNIIERYMNKISKTDVDNFARKNNIFLNEEELEFTYIFVKKNWQTVIANPTALNLERYRDKFSEENLVKIKKLFKEYSTRYKNYL